MNYKGVEKLILWEFIPVTCITLLSSVLGFGPRMKNELSEGKYPQYGSKFTEIIQFFEMEEDKMDLTWWQIKEKSQSWLETQEKSLRSFSITYKVKSLKTKLIIFPQFLIFSSAIKLKQT